MKREQFNKLAIATVSGLMIASVNVLAADGGEIYNKSCVACHSSGVAGAPKKGDSAAWTKRLAEHGKDGAYAIAISGKGAMPPRGTCMQCTDEELKAAVDFMIGQ